MAVAAIEQADQHLEALALDPGTGMHPGEVVEHQGHVQLPQFTTQGLDHLDGREHLDVPAELRRHLVGIGPRRRIGKTLGGAEHMDMAVAGAGRNGDRGTLVHDPENADAGIV
ncbi:hypothetical protein D3C76_1308710 [compost metagenome]